MKSTILVTGANRGLGLELVRQYASDGWAVHACCRNPARADELNELAQSNPGICVHELDVTDEMQIKNLSIELGNTPIDILFNNAGVYGQSDAVFGNTDKQKWLDCFSINTIAPMKMMEAFVNHVASSQIKLIATMSSKMGSMEDNGSGGSYVYRSSKAAVNAIMKSASIDLQPMGIKVAILHPGWVLTDMGGPNAEISVAESVSSLLRNLEKVTMINTGSFWEIDGSVIPW